MVRFFRARECSQSFSRRSSVSVLRISISFLSWASVWTWVTHKLLVSSVMLLIWIWGEKGEHAELVSNSIEIQGKYSLHNIYVMEGIVYSFLLFRFEALLDRCEFFFTCTLSSSKQFKDSKYLQLFCIYFTLKKTYRQCSPKWRTEKRLVFSKRHIRTFKGHRAIYVSYRILCET